MVLSVKEFPWEAARWAGVLPLESFDDMLTPLFTKAYIGNEKKYKYKYLRIKILSILFCIEWHWSKLQQEHIHDLTKQEKKEKNPHNKNSKYQVLIGIQKNIIPVLL